MRQKISNKVFHNGKAIYFDDPQEAALLRELIETAAIVAGNGVAGGEVDQVLISDGSNFVPQDMDYVIDKALANVQGYYGLLSDFYFSGTGTDVEIDITEVGVWQDVVMTVDPSGVSDQRVLSMKEANLSAGHEGDGSDGDPIIFLLEGLEEASFCSLRTSLNFTPDEDGGRLDSRLFVERHSGAGPDFTIDAAGLAMESGADESYPHLVSLDFFIGDTIDTNGPNDAGKIRFQIKADVTGTVTMKEMALFINK